MRWPESESTLSLPAAQQGVGSKRCQIAEQDLQSLITESSPGKSKGMRSGKLLRTAAMMALCLVLFLDAGCKRQSTNSNELFPASNEVAGWAETDGIRTFEAADLWRYIDGDADRYLRAGVQSVSTTDYKFQNQVDAVVDIYTMENAAGARKIFESELAGDAKPLQIGDDARLHSQSLIFRKEAYLVRIVAYEESVETPQAIVLLGQSIERRLTR